ncbi:MAG: guanylate kinase [Planctomycetaceae bacterium]|nr:MAG: guanylate kinase [Planctomycetaceae bacterium]
MVNQSPQIPQTGVVILSGPSGSGKTTIVQRLLAESPLPLVKAISATTRAPRSGEQHGREYYFMTPEEFAQRRARHEFVETAEYAGAWYGTLWSEVERAHQQGAWLLLEIEVQGAKRVMELYPDAISIFLLPPSFEELEHRLRARKTESDTKLQQRLQTARAELAQAAVYRYRVLNDNLDRAVDDIIAILARETGHAPSRSTCPGATCE